MNSGASTARRRASVRFSFRDSADTARINSVMFLRSAGGTQEKRFKRRLLLSQVMNCYAMLSEKRVNGSCAGGASERHGKRTIRTFMNVPSMPLQHLHSILR